MPFDRRSVAVYSAFFLSSLGYSLWYSLFPVYLDVIGFQTWQIGFVFSLLSLSTSLSYLILGAVSDAAGRGKPLALGFILSALTIIALAYTSNIMLIGLLISAYGLLEGLKSPTGEASIVETGARLGTALSLFYMVVMVARIAGSALSGYFASTLGFQSLFILGSLLSISSAFLIVSLYGWSGRLGLKTVRLSVSKFPEGIKSILSDRGLRLLTIALVVHGLGFSMINPLVTLYAKEVLSLDEQLVGLVMAVWNMGFLLTQVPSGKLTDRFGGIPILASHIALSSVSWLLYGFSGNWLHLVLSALFVGMVGAMDMPARRTLMVRLGGSMGVASIIGYMDALTRFTFMLGSSVGGVLWSSLGYRAPFIIGSILNIFALIPLLILIYPHKR
ncbi:MFS transporter [Candidatus Bathyarchaeota archaeon]|nr:MFS transporter [Candidatus Bathyarchaeota archaeon]